MSDLKKSIKYKFNSVSDRLNQKLLKINNGTFSALPVIEFPKSGGTWIAKMIATTVGVPYIDDVFFPINRKCVIRTHWEPSTDYKHALYVIRDVRDVFVSLYFHRERNAAHNTSLAKRYHAVLGEQLDSKKFDHQIVGFLKHEISGWGGGVGCSWNDQVNGAWESEQVNENVYVVKYEDVLKNPESQICAAVEKVYGIPVSPNRVKLVNELFKKENALSASVSQEKTFFRSGKAGEWDSCLTREAGELIAENFNATLIGAGYETDPDWWKVLPS